MRIERGPISVVIVAAAPAQPTAASRSFSALLREPEPRLSTKDAQALLSGAWQEVVGEAPSRETAQLLTAHWALETDAGRAMPGHNFAGIKASPRAVGAFFDTTEGYGAARREVRARFRTYDSPQAGARDYVNLLEKRYPAALEAARVGDLTAFARALAAGNYFTADPAAYSSGLRQRLKNLDKNRTQIERANGVGTDGSGPSVATAASGALLAPEALAGLLHTLHVAEGDS